ncbi:hypothetical protein B296_00027545 [Ensete ventricosum]|uniref:Uncharacterized protein n=1 Tax=Ensete ventricosum TaxID=4639 RepID=A0A427API6_ENSVE|nr:hypothetical protein B296_00027545 [Ensete ventricosum]
MEFILLLQLSLVSDQCFGLALSPGGLTIAVVSLLFTLRILTCTFDFSGILIILKMQTIHWFRGTVLQHY